MKKLFALLILGLLTHAVYAAPISEPVKGSTIEQMKDALEKNTKSTERNTQIVEDIPLKIEGEFTQWVGVHLMGNAIFMTILFLIYLFLDKLRIKRNKKKYTEYLEELETELKTNKLSLIETVSYNNNLMSESNKQLKTVVSDLSRLRAALNHQPQVNHNLRGLILLVGVCIGVLIGVVV